jgi:hypothetical protein
MAFDAARMRVVLFGGVHAQQGAQTYLGDTWEWDGSVWTQTADTGPSPRGGTAMAYDEARERIVLFSGGTAAGPSLADTWEWNGSEWVQVADMGPSARDFHAMAFHAALGRVILVSGRSPVGDTWEWDGMEWTQVADTGPRRMSAAVCYDVARACLTLFGGWEGSGYQSDTWEFADTVWVKRQNMGPGPFVAPKAVHAAPRTILFGCMPDDRPGQTWQWDGARWVQRQNMGPSNRSGYALAYDAQRGRVVLFGGATGSNTLGDTWELTIA